MDLFFKYFSEKLEKKANEFLKTDGIIFNEIDENSVDGKEILTSLKEATMDALGYFLKPSEFARHTCQKRKFKSDQSDNSAKFSQLLYYHYYKG